MNMLMALAHPGHGVTDPSSWRHYLTEPEHVLALGLAAGAVAVSWLVYRRVTSPRARRPPPP